MKEAKKILKAKYGSDRFEVKKSGKSYRVLVHYPNMVWRGHYGKEVAVEDMWAKFSLNDQAGLISNYPVSATRTTLLKGEDRLTCAHSMTNSVIGTFSRPCAGEYNTPIRLTAQDLYKNGFSPERFTAYLNALDVFMEFDNYGNGVARLGALKSSKPIDLRSVPVRFKEISTDFRKEVFKGITSDHFTISLVGNEVNICETDLLEEFVSKVIQDKKFYHRDLVCTKSVNTYYSLENRREAIEEKLGYASFTFKNKKVKIKRTNGNPKIYAHPKIKECIVKELQKRLLKASSS